MPFKAPDKSGESIRLQPMRSKGQAFKPGIEERDYRDRRENDEDRSERVWARSEFQLLLKRI
jgi:hypothetical protein